MIDKKLEIGVISSLITDSELVIEYSQDLNENLFHNHKCKVLLKSILDKFIDFSSR